MTSAVNYFKVEFRIIDTCLCAADVRTRLIALEELQKQLENDKTPIPVCADK